MQETPKKIFLDNLQQSYLYKIIFLRREKFYGGKSIMKLIIDNIETDYDIYENGDIYSHKTNTVLKGSIFNTGYRMVRLTINGKKKAYAVHRVSCRNLYFKPK